MKTHKDMKKVLIIPALGALLFVGCSPKGYVLEGNIPHAADGDVVYLQANPRAVPVDSAVVTDGKFKFTSPEADGTPMYLIYSISDRANASYAEFYQENGKLKAAMVKASEGRSIVTGTPLNDIAAEFNKGQDAIASKYSELEESLKDAADDAKAAIQAEADKLDAAYDENVAQAIEKNITNRFGAALLLSNYYSMAPDKVTDLIGKIPQEIKEGNNSYDRIAENCAKQVATGPGQKFTDFTLKTPEGKEVSLSDFAGKGSLVLVDFWASWCGPCIREMPNVKKAYADFNKKGFEIVGVSLDRDEQAWKDAIKKLDLPWKHMSDVKYWECEAAKLYGVNSIPATVLIGPDGTILERNLRGEKLYAKIAEILK